MAKTYYWLKLKQDFFGSKAMKKLRKIAGGDTYTIIYLKMQLKSLKDNGNLYYDGVEQSFADEIALDIDEEPDDVKVAISFLIQVGLIEEVSDTQILMSTVPELTGKECESAERVRKHREKIASDIEKTLQCNTGVTNCNTEIEIELDIEKDKKIYTQPSVADTQQPSKPVKEIKHKYGEYKHVLLKDSELEKLNNDFGEPETLNAIKYLDEYIEMKGTSYKSHYMAMRKWVFDAVKQHKKEPKQQSKNKFNNFKQRDYDYDDLEKQLLQNNKLAGGN